MTVGKSKHERFRVTVEPVLLSLGFCASFAGSVTTNLYIRQYCTWYGYGSLEQCRTNRENYEEVHESVSRLIAISQWMSHLGPAFLGFFAGSWSDTNGRKPFMIVGVASQLVYWTIFTCLSMSHSIHPYLLLVPSLIWLFTGGTTVTTIMAICYLTDITNEQNRSFRLGVALSLEYAIMLASTLLSPVVFNKGSYWGFVSVFAINALFFMVLLIYVIFFLPESVDEVENKAKFFTRKHAISIYKTVVRQRPLNRRTILCLLIIADVLSNLFIAGESQVKYLAVTISFNWDLGQYNVYSAASLLISFCGTVLSLAIFSKWLGISDAPLLAGAYVLKCAASLIDGFARTPIMLFMGSIVGCTSLVVLMLNKSMATKIVDEEESGVIMVLMALLNSIVAIFSSLLYTTVYAACVTWSPLAVFFTTSIISATSFLIVLVVLYLIRRANVGSTDLNQELIDDDSNDVICKAMKCYDPVL